MDNFEQKTAFITGAASGLGLGLGLGLVLTKALVNAGVTVFGGPGEIPFRDWQWNTLFTLHCSSNHPANKRPYIR
ncbi:hypothetical protein FKG94_16180 [Exilibacterium tricleocarpae]|uniref:Uncharacterized protein n=1 Tax=Exilibacterium tricleocarpae TaxID=2591008 RepID=A0A545TBF8_9GAMM|nr:hypothetical protein FKG94_16180 [Exilibacterium tricleocarpae]